MEYELKRSERKTIAISVKEGRVILRAPISLPRKEADQIISEHLDWINNKLALYKKKMEENPEPQGQEIVELKKAACEYFAEETRRIAGIMHLRYKTVNISSAKKRFGSCSSKGDIYFSYRLMLYPVAAREYVIVHELAHLLEMNHSEKFYKIVETYLPDYKERRKLLRK